MTREVSKILLDRGSVHTTDRGAALTVDTDGLVAFYPMEGDDQLLMLDESKNGRVGKIFGATRRKGIAGNGLFFNPGEYVEIHSDSAIDFDFDDFTYCFFINPRQEGKILHKRSDAAGYEASFQDNRIYALFEDPDFQSELVSVTRITHGQDYFVTVVRERGVGKLYIDAVEEDRTSCEYDLSNDKPLIFGGNSGMGMTGLLDEVYLYDRALSDLQIRNIYKKYMGLP